MANVIFVTLKSYDIIYKIFLLFKIKIFLLFSLKNSSLKKSEFFNIFSYVILSLLYYVPCNYINTEKK